MLCGGYQRVLFWKNRYSVGIDKERNNSEGHCGERGVTWNVFTSCVRYFLSCFTPCSVCISDVFGVPQIIIIIIIQITVSKLTFLELGY